MHDRAGGAVYWQIVPVPPSFQLDRRCKVRPQRADGKVFRVHREASRAVMDSAVHKFPESRRSPSCPRFTSPRAYFRSARADPRLFRPARASLFRKNFLSTWRLILSSLHSKRFIRLVNRTARKRLSDEIDRRSPNSLLDSGTGVFL